MGLSCIGEQRGSGPRLLFCNRSGLTLHDVRPLLDPLTASFDLLAWDYQGFGRSAPVTHPYTMADIAADAAGLLEIAGWKSCRLIGASFGGMVAQEFAVTHPQRVERLALACTSAGGEGGSSYPLQELLELPPGQGVAAELKVVDSRWDQRWLEAHPPDRAIAERMTAAGQDQQDPAAVAAYQAQLQAREGHDGCQTEHDVVQAPAGYRLGSERGSPNQGRTLLSKRVMAQIRSPVRVSTYRPVPWRMPVGARR
jgi:3-oxoadipate enol-lactonase